jgi:hypothetical protein
MVLSGSDGEEVDGNEGMEGMARGEGFEERGWDRWVKSAVSREDCWERLSRSAW